MLFGLRRPAAVKRASQLAYPKSIRRACVRGCAVLVAGMGVATSAHAGLGEHSATVVRDQKVIGANADHVTRAALYDLHELTAPSGAVLREYVSRDGAVFAVSYRGLSMPNLQAILGTGHAHYVRAARAGQRNHHVVNVASADINIRVRKLQRGVEVAANLPAQIPNGVTIPSLR
jgi:hypothetical protein